MISLILVSSAVSSNSESVVQSDSLDSLIMVTSPLFTEYEMFSTSITVDSKPLNAAGISVLLFSPSFFLLFATGVEVTITRKVTVIGV